MFFRWECAFYSQVVWIINDMRKVKNMNDVKNLVKKYVDNKYSYNFVDVLTKMLNLYEKDRPDFIELCNMV